MNELVYERLTALSIPYEVTDHAPVYTMEDMDAQGLHDLGVLCKNLFVRDAKGKRHFLVVAREDTPVDLRTLGERLEAGKLSFASAQRLEKYLGVTTGAVSPFGLLHDTERAVTVVLDQSLQGEARLGIHPNDNTATVWLSWDALQKFIDAQENPLVVLAF